MRVIRDVLAAAAFLSCMIGAVHDARAEDGADPQPPSATTKPGPVRTNNKDHKDSKDNAWRARFDAARSDLVEGRYRRAEIRFQTLALEAPTAAERSLAIEMSKLAIEYAERGESGRSGPTSFGSSLRGDIRGSDELTLLYASAFLYGAGAGTWFLLETRPTSGLTATLPFAAMTAAPAVGIAIVDHFERLPRGVPHAISAGLYVGLGEGVALVGFQHARATRIADRNNETEIRWSSATTAGVLWGSATAGAVLGGALGTSLLTTPGRVSFAASTAMWSGAIVGLGSGAVMPNDEHRAERAFALGAVFVPVGLGAGLLLAGNASPTVARIRLVDLIGVAGGFSAGGLYLAAARDGDPRAAEGFAAAGALAGLTAGWLLTSGMPKDDGKLKPSGGGGGGNARVSASTSPSTAPTLEPFLAPALGGATIGAAGSF